MNRSPRTRPAMAEAVRQWLKDATDQADINFERALLDQGVITPDESIEQIEGGNGRVYVTLEGGAYLAINHDGRVYEEQ